MAIWPVEREIWKRDGIRLVSERTYVMKLVPASCRANCFRILHNSVGPSIVLIMYWKRNLQLK